MREGLAQIPDNYGTVYPAYIKFIEDYRMFYFETNTYKIYLFNFDGFNGGDIHQSDEYNFVFDPTNYPSPPLYPYFDFAEYKNQDGTISNLKYFAYGAVGDTGNENDFHLIELQDFEPNPPVCTTVFSGTTKEALVKKRSKFGKLEWISVPSSSL
jgi:hypothetical protein